jgi:hypothetical protein
MRYDMLMSNQFWQSVCFLTLTVKIYLMLFCQNVGYSSAGLALNVGILAEPNLKSTTLLYGIGKKITSFDQTTPCRIFDALKFR